MTKAFESSADSILKTIVYHQLFDFILNLTELEKYLIEQPASAVELNQTLALLPNVQLENNLNDRPVRIQAWKNLTQSYALAQRILLQIPTIRCVAVSGSTAALNSRNNADIDLLLICQNQTAWLTRLLVLTTLSILGLRVNLNQSPEKQAGKFCVNMILADTQNSLKTRHRDLYTAMEIAHLKIVLNQKHTFQKFLCANEWIKSYLPNFWRMAEKEWNLQDLCPDYPKPPQWTNPNPTHPILRFVDNLAKIIQQKHYQWSSSRHRANSARPETRRQLQLTGMWQIDFRELTLQRFQAKWDSMRSGKFKRERRIFR